MGLTRASWAGRRVLVTGHTGFKGAWLALWLQELGAEVVGYARDVPTRPALYEDARVGEGMETVWGEIADYEAVAAAVEAHRPEIVFHLAAQALVGAGHRAPVATFATNVMGTVCVLEALRRVGGVRVAVVVTTDKVYAAGGAAGGAGHRESDPLGGEEPYGASKAAAEHACAAYRRAYFGEGPAVATVRAGNVIGGGDWARDRLVPDLVRGALAREVVALRDPDAVRPWQHVLCPLEGYLVLAERLVEQPELARAWNFGPRAEDARPVRWVAERFAALWGEGSRWEPRPGPHPPEARFLRLNASLARAELGWRPRWDLDTGLAAVVAFHRAVASGADARALMREQLDAYARGAPARGQILQ